MAGEIPGPSPEEVGAVPKKPPVETPPTSPEPDDSSRSSQTTRRNEEAKGKHGPGLHDRLWRWYSNRRGGRLGGQKSDALPPEAASAAAQAQIDAMEANQRVVETHSADATAIRLENERNNRAGNLSELLHRGFDNPEDLIKALQRYQYDEFKVARHGEGLLGRIRAFRAGEFDFRYQNNDARQGALQMATEVGRRAARAVFNRQVVLGACGALAFTALTGGWGGGVLLASYATELALAGTVAGGAAVEFIDMIRGRNGTHCKREAMVTAEMRWWNEMQQKALLLNNPDLPLDRREVLVHEIVETYYRQSKEGGTVNTEEETVTKELNRADAELTKAESGLNKWRAASAAVGGIIGGVAGIQVGFETARHGFLDFDMLNRAGTHVPGVSQSWYHEVTSRAGEFLFQTRAAEQAAGMAASHALTTPALAGQIAGNIWSFGLLEQVAPVVGLAALGGLGAGSRAEAAERTRRRNVEHDIVTDKAIINEGDVEEIRLRMGNVVPHGLPNLPADWAHPENPYWRDFNFENIERWWLVERNYREEDQQTSPDAFSYALDEYGDPIFIGIVNVDQANNQITYVDKKMIDGGRFIANDVRSMSLSEFYKKYVLKPVAKDRYRTREADISANSPEGSSPEEDTAKTETPPVSKTDTTETPPVSSDSSNTPDKKAEAGETDTEKAKETELTTEETIDAMSQVLIEGDDVKGIPLTKEALINARLEPKIKIEIGGSAVLLSSLPYKIDSDGRLGVVAYVEKDGKLVARTYYRSNSQDVWRYLPAYSPDSWSSKGNGAEGPILPSNAQKALVEISSRQPVEVANPDLIFFGTAKKLAKGPDTNDKDRREETPATPKTTVEEKTPEPVREPMPVIEKTKEELRAELSPVLDDLIGYFNKFKKPSLELPLTFSERPGHSKGDIIKAGSLNYEHKGEKYSVEVHLDNDERVKAKRIIDEKGKEAIGLVEFYDPRIVDFPVVHLQVRGRLIEEDTTPTAVPKEETPPVETETEVPPVEPEKTEETPAVAEPPTPEAAKEVELGVTPPPELAEVPPPKMERTETKPVVENLKVGDRFRFNPDFYKNNSLNTLRQELRDLFFQDVTDPKPAKQNGKRNQKMEDAIFEVINSDGENIAIKRVTADGLSEDMSVVNSAEILSSLSKV